MFLFNECRTVISSNFKGETLSINKCVPRVQFLRTAGWQVSCIAEAADPCGLGAGILPLVKTARREKRNPKKCIKIFPRI